MVPFNWVARAKIKINQIDMHRVKAEHCKDDDDDDITDDERKADHMMNPNLGHPHHLQHPSYHHHHHHHHAMLSAYGGIKEEIPGMTKRHSNTIPAYY